MRERRYSAPPERAWAIAVQGAGGAWINLHTLARTRREAIAAYNERHRPYATYAADRRVALARAVRVTVTVEPTDG